MKLICERTTFIPGFRVFTLHRNRSGVSRPLDPFNYLSSTDRYPERLSVHPERLLVCPGRAEGKSQFDKYDYGSPWVAAGIVPNDPWRVEQRTGVPSEAPESTRRMCAWCTGCTGIISAGGFAIDAPFPF